MPTVNAPRRVQEAPSSMTALTALPSPPARPIVGHALQLRSRPLEFLTHCAQVYGDVVRLQAGPSVMVLLNHPDLVRDVLVTSQRAFDKGRAFEKLRPLVGNGLLTSEGDIHRRQRRFIQPAFHRQRIAGYADVMRDEAARTASRWCDGELLDLQQELQRVTLAIVAQTLFGTEMGNRVGEIQRSLPVVQQGVNRRIFSVFDGAERLPLPANRRFAAAVHRLRRLTDDLIAARRATAADGSDLLSMLLAVRDDQGRPMTGEQVRDEAITILLAGHETTANALTWTFHLLAQNRSAEARLHAELDEVLGGRPPGFDDLPRLACTRRVLTEAMRLFPPVWASARRTLNDYQAEAHTIPSGTNVLMSPYVLHRDPRFHHQPERFEPDRWLPERAADLPRFAYFPFGGGPRQCIGEQFTWTEGTILLATLAGRWRLRPVPGTPVQPHPMVTLRPRHGLPMTAHRREARTARQPHDGDLDPPAT
jgi:cytochrome P450